MFKGFYVIMTSTLSYGQPPYNKDNIMARRTGLTTIKDLANKLCRLTASFTPIIKRAYPNNDALHLALDTANAACAVLVEEAIAALPVGD